MSDIEKANHAGLVPAKVTYQREGKTVSGTRWVKPGGAPGRPDPAGKKLKQNRSEEEQIVRDAQHRQQMEAKERQRQEQGIGEFAEYGPAEIPWTERMNVKQTDVGTGTKFEGKGLSIDIQDTGAGWRIYRNGSPVGTVNRERDALNYAENEFNKLVKALDGEEVKNVTQMAT